MSDANGTCDAQEAEDIRICYALTDHGVSEINEDLVFPKEIFQRVRPLEVDCARALGTLMYEAEWKTALGGPVEHVYFYRYNGATFVSSKPPVEPLAVDSTFSAKTDWEFGIWPAGGAFEGTSSFSDALEFLKDGESVTRVGWNGNGQYLTLQEPAAHSKMRKPYIYIRPVDGELVPWVASQTDLLAEDWIML